MDVQKINPCKMLEISVDDHFREVTKMVRLGAKSLML